MHYCSTFIGGFVGNVKSGCITVAEFCKLGAAIIFANFSTIILETGKEDLCSAKAYCDRLLKALQTRDLFEWIEIEPQYFWHPLLFMDQDHFVVVVSELTYKPWDFDLNHTMDDVFLEDGY